MPKQNPFEKPSELNPRLAELVLQFADRLQRQAEKTGGGEGLLSSAEQRRIWEDLL
jgi:hypothetical protein